MPVPALPPPPPAPNGQVLALLAALSNPSVDHDRHTAALKARDDALSSSSESYGDLCRNFARILGCPSIDALPADELSKLSQSDPTSWMQLRHDPSSWSTFRQMAGLLLKNALVAPPVRGPVDAVGRPPPDSRVVLPPDVASEIRHVLIRCIIDPEPAVRSASSTCVSRSAVGVSDLAVAEPPLPLRTWAELAPFLRQCVECGLDTAPSPEVNAIVEGSLVTLRKMLEDAPAQFETHADPATFQGLVAVLLRTLESPDEKRRRESLKCLNCLIPTMPGVLVAHMQDYLRGLSALAMDKSPNVRSLVCQAIVMLLSLRTEYLQTLMPSISEFMLTATSDTDENVALEACEFWLTFASLDEDACTSEMTDTVRSMLPRLIPILLQNIVYPKEKIEELLEANALDESNAADRAQDLAPVFHSSRAKRGGEDESDDDDDDDDDFETDNEWTVRKCSAASLDTLAGLFSSEDVLPTLLPALQEGLSHEDQWVREANILALGAIADGCRDAISVHMGALHPFLMAQLTAPESIPQLKSIAAWTLGRYASWAVEQVHNGAQPELIGKMTEVLMGRILDPNRSVQIAACSAFGVLIESTGDMMAPYLEPVYRTFLQALGMYQTRSLMVVFDTLGTMADYIGPAIGEGPLPGIFIPALLHMWNEVAKQDPFDRLLLPLMECLASNALVMRMNFQPWALETFEMAMSTVEACTLMFSTCEDYIDDDDADPMVCAADLLDGLVEGLSENFATLVASSKRYGEHFLSVLHNLTQHDVAGVRMSAFALIGDLARNSPALLESGLPQLLTEAVSCIDPDYPSVCNNAVWALGEVCVRCGDNPAPLQPFASGIVQNLMSLLMGYAVDGEDNAAIIPGLAENAAAAMGRLAKVNANFVAGDLPRFLKGWCEGMAKISDPNERNDAFQGFILALHTNPQSVQSEDVIDIVTSIMFAIVSWHLPTQESPSLSMLNGQYCFQPFPQEFAELGTALGKLLQDLKAAAGEEAWGEIERHMPVNVRRLMREAYHI